MAFSTDEHRRLLAEALAQADADIGELRARLAEREPVAGELTASRAECAQLRRDLAGLTSSLSWRITAPLRLAAARARAVRDGRLISEPAEIERAFAAVGPCPRDPVCDERPRVELDGHRVRA